MNIGARDAKLDDDTNIQVEENYLNYESIK